MLWQEKEETDSLSLLSFRKKCFNGESSALSKRFLSCRHHRLFGPWGTRYRKRKSTKYEEDRLNSSFKDRAEGLTKRKKKTWERPRERPREWSRRASMKQHRRVCPQLEAFTYERPGQHRWWCDTDKVSCQVYKTLVLYCLGFKSFIGDF